MSTNDGGPAFPIETQAVQRGEGLRPWTIEGSRGISIRDYFAAKAMPIAAKVFEDGHPNGWENIAIAAYSIADAMIAARETK